MFRHLRPPFFCHCPREEIPVDGLEAGAGFRSRKKRVRHPVAQRRYGFASMVFAVGVLEPVLKNLPAGLLQLHQSIWVEVPYHLTTWPSGLRTGVVRLRCHR